MLEEFEQESHLIHEIELEAKTDITSIVTIFKDSDDWYYTKDEQDRFIWDSSQGKTLEDILKDLRNGYTAIPF